MDSGGMVRCSIPVSFAIHRMVSCCWNNFIVLQFFSNSSRLLLYIRRKCETARLMQLQVKYIINWHVMYVRVLLGILDSPVPPLPYQHVIAYNNLDVPWAATQLTPPVPIPLYTYLQWPNSIPTGYHLFPGGGGGDDYYT